MSYYIVNNFSAGLDLRRSSLTAPAGTLRTLTNLHVTPGGEIEKRYAFQKFATVAATTKGLAEVNQKLYVFGPNGPGKIEPPADWTVGTLQLDTSVVYDVIDYDLFDNKIFVIVTIDAAGDVMRFYDGVNVPGAKGLYCRTYKTKMFTVAGSVLYFSAVGAADDWAGTGSGFLDLSLEDSDMTDCVALEVYYDKLAILSSTATQLWTIDPDPLQTQYNQTLRQAGTIAPRSVLSYGSGDVLFVAPDGIRSLRARNASLAASVSDVGSPLDPIMQDLARTVGTNFMSQIIALLQPVTGRFWIILPDRIYILSAFPGPKVTAWSEYIPTDASGATFSIVAATVYRKHVVVRDTNNNIYAFGGASDTGPVYDTCPVEIVFPFHAGEEPATFKVFHGLDCACTGEWEVYAAYDPNNDSAEDYLGKFVGPTFLQGRFPMEGHSTHMSIRMRSTVDGPLTVSNLIVHYDKAETG